MLTRTYKWIFILKDSNTSKYRNYYFCKIDISQKKKIIKISLYTPFHRKRDSTDLCGNCYTHFKSLSKSKAGTYIVLRSVFWGGGVPAPWEEKRKKGRGKKGNRGKTTKGNKNNVWRRLLAKKTNLSTYFGMLELEGF